MSKHIIDGPRKAGEGTRATQYARIERETGEGHRPQAEAKLRRVRTRDPNEKLKRFTEIDRRDD